MSAVSSVREPAPCTGIVVWDVDLRHAHADLHRCHAVLSGEERERAARFVRIEDRQRFSASHAALRLILGRQLGVPARELDFSTETAGKPHLAGAWAGACQFNLSHSGDFALIGLSSKVPVGVDVEQVRPIPDLLRIARTYFAASEIAALDALPASALTTAFYACWTRKEAMVKATGQGLSLPLDRFAVSVTPEQASLLTMPGGTRDWSLHSLAVAPAYAAALAIAAADTEYGRFSLPPHWPTLLGTP